MFLGQIVKHGDIKCVLNEGMPIYRRPYEKGRLIIEFKVNSTTEEYLRMVSFSISGCQATSFILHHVQKEIPRSHDLKLLLLCWNIAC
jgi:hypothetical protein